MSADWKTVAPAPAIRPDVSEITEVQLQTGKLERLPAGRRLIPNNRREFQNALRVCFQPGLARHENRAGLFATTQAVI